MRDLLLVAGQSLLTLVLYLSGVLLIGISIFPGLWISYHLWTQAASWSMGLRILLLSFSISASFFLYGITIIFLVGFLRIIFRLNLQEGEYRLGSVGSLRWFVVNSLFYVVSVTFMDFILLTPLAAVFYRLMGAKVGRHVQINSKFGADLSLLEIGDESVIGGHSTVICHSFERGRLILKKVKIGKKATVGLNAVILPGCEIGEGALIAAGAVLGKGTIVPPHSVYSGVPAESAKDRHRKDE